MVYVKVKTLIREGEMGEGLFFAKQLFILAKSEATESLRSFNFSLELCSGLIIYGLLAKKSVKTVNKFRFEP